MRCVGWRTLYQKVYAEESLTDWKVWGREGLARPHQRNWFGARSAFSFFCPLRLGHPRASGYCSQSEGPLFVREPTNVRRHCEDFREEPEKQRQRSCRAQELSRSRAQEKVGRRSWCIEPNEARDGMTGDGKGEDRSFGDFALTASRESFQRLL